MRARRWNKICAGGVTMRVTRGERNVERFTPWHIIDGEHLCNFVEWKDSVFKEMEKELQGANT